MNMNNTIKLASTRREPPSAWQQRRHLEVLAAAQPGSTSNGAVAAGSSNSNGETQATPKRGGAGPAAPGSATLRTAAEASNNEVYDKLILVFGERDSSEWRKLIAFSKQWPNLAQGVFKRIDQRVEAEEDGEKALQLRKLGRKLKEVDDETQQYRRLIAKFQSAPQPDWEGIVATQRTVLTTEFFMFGDCLARAAKDDKDEQEALLTLLGRVAALVAAYDQLEADQDAMDLAAQKFQSLLEVGSLEEMDSKIDTMAAGGQLDPALMLLLAKAHQSAKDTDMTREAVRDIMAHLYWKAKESFSAQLPAEVRILKHLLSLEDPKERLAALGEAFTPGPELSTEDQDYLATTPERLMVTMGAVLNAFEAQRGRSTMVGEAADLMNPAVIERMRELQQLVRKQYM